MFYIFAMVIVIFCWTILSKDLVLRNTPRIMTSSACKTLSRAEEDTLHEVTLWARDAAVFEPAKPALSQPRAAPSKVITIQRYSQCKVTSDQDQDDQDSDDRLNTM